jgi:hypothetical protein
MLFNYTEQLQYGCYESFPFRQFFLFSSARSRDFDGLIGIKTSGVNVHNKNSNRFVPNMIDKTMCEVLWRNISDFYVDLRVELGKHSHVILAMYFYLGQE